MAADILGDDPCPLYDRYGPDDRYRMIRQIGRGGEGVVFAADDVRTGRRLALKVLYRDGRIDPAHFAARFADVHIKRPHGYQHVVEVLATGMSRQRVFIAMELLEGPTVREWLDEPGRTFDDRLRIVRELTLGHQAVHAVRVCVEDAHPKNCVMTRDRGLVMVDPPTAGKHRAWQSAPEILLAHAGDFWNTRASDQYALAFTSWVVLFGRKPFELDAATKQAFGHLERYHAEHELGVRLAEIIRVASPAGDTSQAPRHVVAALRRAMSYDAADRYPSVADFAAALEGPAQ